MKRLKIFKAYFVLWLFVYFIAMTNVETFKLYFLSTLTFNIAIVSLLAIGTFMLLKAAKDLTMIAGTFGVIMYKKGDISFYLKGIDKIFPTTIAKKIKTRAKNRMLFFTNQEADDILAWLEEKFSNQNKYNNFFIGTVLMIGLLGTFAGLLGSISSMGGIVKSLAGNDVDIGKIMAGFATPLSSMAVGFGSSLFGVISAVLLSIKGYLLNKSQESLLSGVENWLQDRRVEESLNSDEKLKESSPSYMDIFVEEMREFKDKISELSKENNHIKESLTQMVTHLREDSKVNKEMLLDIGSSFEQVANTNRQNIDYIASLGSSIKQLSTMQKDWLVELSKKDESIKELLAKQERRDSDLNVGIFQIVDAIENMNKNIIKKDKDLEKILKSNEKENRTISDVNDFLTKDLFKDEEYR